MVNHDCSSENNAERRRRRPGLKRREYDEDDVRIRPGRSSRPRTHRRPSHDDAVDGFVMAVDRGRYTCVVAGHSVVAIRARELGRRGVVVGDRVRLVGDVSGQTDALARIVRIADRSSVLTRTADDDDSSSEARVERTVVANADQLVIVSSLSDPPPRTGFIDRCLVAAYDAGIAPLLCLTKSDLAGPEEVLGYYAELDLPAVLCNPVDPLTDLETALAGKVSVLIGHSGVGKSTLVNRLIPDAARAVGVVSAVGKGRHTSTSVVAMPLDGVVRMAGQPGSPAPKSPAEKSAGSKQPTSKPVTSKPPTGWIIDTPGIRSFGLAGVSADSLLHGFPDLVEASTQCPPGCDHTGATSTEVGPADAGHWGAGSVGTGHGGTGSVGTEHGVKASSEGRVATVCGLDRLVASGRADPRRLASYRRLLASRSGEPVPE